jgi:hypothetical protein
VKHKKDLLAANCTEYFVEKWCEGQEPPAPPAPGGGCSVALKKQLSKRKCALNVSYGCCAGLAAPPPGCNAGAMWTSTGCRGDFELDGQAVECDDTTTSAKPSACAPKPPKPPPPPINASTVTVLVFGDSSHGPKNHSDAG